MKVTVLATTDAGCANILCSNQPHEGGFELVEIRSARHGSPGVPIVRLWVCTPCASVLTEEGRP